MAGMIVGEFVNADLDLSGAVAFLGLHTAAGRDYARHRFEHPVDTENGLRGLQEPIIAIRSRFRKEKTLEGEVRTVLRDLSNAELAVNEMTNFNTIDKRIAETIEQVFWKEGTMGSFLNTWGWMIELILFHKTLFLPGFAVLMPFLVVILPYVLLNNMFGMEINLTEYCNVLQRIILSNAPALPVANEASPLSKAAKYLYMLMSLGVFVSNIWNQIQAAIHLRTVADDIRDRGQKIIDYVAASRRLADLLNNDEGRANADSVGFTDKTNALGAFGMMYNESRALARLRDWVAEIDLNISAALLKGICFPKVKRAEGFSMSIQGLYHPGVPAGRRVLNDYNSASHMLLTGPNRGGKSTLCKSVGLAVMTAQSWGIVWARSMTFTPIVRFETALAPADTLGRMSLFEAEIEFAKHLISVADKARTDKQEGPVMIIMDEIFHSTNAHDGAEASLIFLKQLYEKGGKAVGSLVSTHYRELPDQLGTAAETWCMEAHDKGDKGIEYTYRCVPGISTVSSVREILQERGLLVV